MSTITPVMNNGNAIDTSIFTDLQSKIDEESEIRESLRNIVENLTKQGRLTQSILSHVHNTPTSSLPDAVLKPAEQSIQEQVITLKSLADTASKYPFYKWNNIWQRDVQNIVGSVQLLGWLKDGRLVSLEEIGEALSVPVNLKNQDLFHITIEDYLLALCGTIEELARLAPNAVTQGDFTRPVQISKFVKDVHAGFQLLNLKNDALRRRSDGIKYSVKKVEDVVYDLSLRGLISQGAETAG